MGPDDFTEVVASPLSVLFGDVTVASAVPETVTFVPAIVASPPDLVSKDAVDKRYLPFIEPDIIPV